MRGLVLLTCAVSALAVVAFNTPPTQAATIVNVSPFGSDTGTCGASGTPCKTLQGAINRAAADDTVKLQQASDYGPATIDKSINILGVQGAGVFSPAGGPCIRVAATVSDVVVIVTEFTCDMGGAAFDGIQFDSGDSLFLSKVVVRGGTGDTCGVFFQPNGVSFLTMTDTTVTAFRSEDNDNAGVCIAPRAGGTATATLQRVNLSANDIGLSSATQPTSIGNVTVVDSDIDGNFTSGIESTGINSRVFVKHCLVAMNPKGLVDQLEAKIISLGDNNVIGNGSHETFTAIQATE